MEIEFFNYRRKMGHTQETVSKDTYKRYEQERL